MIRELMSRRRPLFRLRAPDPEEWTPERRYLLDKIKLGGAEAILGTPALQFCRYLVQAGHITDHLPPPEAVERAVRIAEERGR